ncbi:Alpha and gamma adaptin binding protein p34 [Ceratocystis lukuohia]|uniref:Alpha and gamma adaptin binding protein p34 n=1 Tax=Ceratocystis lukuohia TaxID=2019550 RepID=A0ABR4MDC9_9PEZI
MSASDNLFVYYLTERLPLEILTEILKPLQTGDLGSLRLCNKALNTKLAPQFYEQHFSTLNVSMSLPSLRALIKISRCEKVAGYIKAMRFQYNDRAFYFEASQNDSMLPVIASGSHILMLQDAIRVLPNLHKFIIVVSSGSSEMAQYVCFQSPIVAAANINHPITSVEIEYNGTRGGGIDPRAIRLLKYTRIAMGPVLRSLTSLKLALRNTSLVDVMMPSPLSYLLSETPNLRLLRINSERSSTDIDAEIILNSLVSDFRHGQELLEQGAQLSIVQDAILDEGEVKNDITLRPLELPRVPLDLSNLRHLELGKMIVDAGVLSKVIEAFLSQLHTFRLFRVGLISEEVDIDNIPDPVLHLNKSKNPWCEMFKDLANMYERIHQREGIYETESEHGTNSPGLANNKLEMSFEYLSLNWRKSTASQFIGFRPQIYPLDSDLLMKREIENSKSSFQIDMLHGQKPTCFRNLANLMVITKINGPHMDSRWGTLGGFAMVGHQIFGSTDDGDAELEESEEHHDFEDYGEYEDYGNYEDYGEYEEGGGGFVF